MIKKILLVFVGLVFIFSGFIKLNDPIGFALKIETYLYGFSLDISILANHFLPYSRLIAIGICTIEVVLGVALLIRYQVKITLYLLLFLMVFFTFLAIYTLWIRNIGSCGCLSQAIPITAKQSLFKNIILLWCLYILLTDATSHKPTAVQASRQYKKLACLAFFCISSICMGSYTLFHLPIIDFGPYPIGHQISVLNTSKMQEEAHNQATHHDQKLAQKKLFKGIADADTLYQTNQKGNFNEKIANNAAALNFLVWDDHKIITNELLEGEKLLCIAQNSTKVDADQLQLLKKICHVVRPSIHIFWLLAVHENGLTSLVDNNNKYPIIWTSAQLLHDLLRADVGLVFLKNGKIIKKWTYHELGAAKKFLTS